jgi:hypothetical protein
LAFDRLLLRQIANENAAGRRRFRLSTTDQNAVL